MVIAISRPFVDTVGSSVLGVAWGVLVLLGAHRLRPAPSRILQITRPTVDRVVGGPRIRHPERVVTTFTLMLVVLAGPMPGLILCGALIGFAARWRRSRNRRHEDRVIAELPHAIELLSLAVASGLTPRLALQAIAPQLHGPVGAALQQLTDELARGVRTAEAIERLPQRLGDMSRSLVAALLDAERYGAPLGPTLDGLGSDARLHRRRHAEERARRLPVTLLFPLVFCVLPAFVLLTVVPIVLATLDRLRLP